MCAVLNFCASGCILGRTIYLDSLFLGGVGEGGCIIYLDSYLLYSGEEGPNMKFGSHRDGSGVGVLTLYECVCVRPSMVLSTTLKRECVGTTSLIMYLVDPPEPELELIVALPVMKFLCPALTLKSLFLLDIFSVFHHASA